MAAILAGAILISLTLIITRRRQSARNDAIPVPVAIEAPVVNMEKAGEQSNTVDERELRSEQIGGRLRYPEETSVGGRLQGSN